MNRAPALRPPILALLVLATTLFAPLPAVASPAADDVFAAARNPGPQHRALEKLAGRFDLTATFWPDPAAPPEVTRLPARRELILGGRVLRLEAGPSADGFRGTGLMGYDNTAGSHWYTWTDTSTTGLSTLVGQVDARGAGTFSGQLPTPFGPTALRVEIRFEDGAEIHDYFVPAPEGRGERRLLELRYQRRAGKGSGG